MVRKLRGQGITEIALMEMAQVGVRSRTRTRAEAVGAATAAAAATAGLAAKRRKLNGEESRLSSSSHIQLRNGTINTGTKTTSDSLGSSPGLELLDHDRTSTSCCSSNGSSERIEFVDLKDGNVEVETSTCYGCKERREKTPSSEAESESDELDSTSKPSTEANSRRRSTAEKMPTESEIDHFFSEVEKKILREFSDKYNFDFEKEEPTEGRYEWVRLKP